MTITTSTKVFLFLFTSTLCSVVPSKEKDYFDSAEEDDDTITAESYPMGVVAPLIPPPFGHRANVPYDPSSPPYGTSSTYHEQDYGGYGAYRFGYKVEDPYTNNYQSRDEEKDDYGTVKGSYSLVEPDGNIRTVYYIADKFGFRAFVKNSHKPSSSHGLPPPF